MDTTVVYEFEKWDDLIRFGNEVSRYEIWPYILMEEHNRVELHYTEHARSDILIDNALKGCRGIWNKIEKENK